MANLNKAPNFARGTAASRARQGVSRTTGTGTGTSTPNANANSNSSTGITTTITRTNTTTSATASTSISTSTNNTSRAQSRKTNLNNTRTMQTSRPSSALTVKSTSTSTSTSTRGPASITDRPPWNRPLTKVQGSVHLGSVRRESVSLGRCEEGESTSTSTPASSRENVRREYFSRRGSIRQQGEEQKGKGVESRGSLRKGDGDRIGPVSTGPGTGKKRLSRIQEMQSGELGGGQEKEKVKDKALFDEELRRRDEAWRVEKGTSQPRIDMKQETARKDEKTVEPKVGAGTSLHADSCEDSATVSRDISRSRAGSGTSRSSSSSSISEVSSVDSFHTAPEYPDSVSSEDSFYTAPEWPEGEHGDGKGEQDRAFLEVRTICDHWESKLESIQEVQREMGFLRVDRA